MGRPNRVAQFTGVQSPGGDDNVSEEHGGCPIVLVSTRYELQGPFWWINPGLTEVDGPIYWVRSSGQVDKRGVLGASEF